MNLTASKSSVSKTSVLRLSGDLMLMVLASEAAAGVAGVLMAT
jgi:hypothetical protein